MTVIVIFVVLGLAGFALLWSRFSSARSDKRSMEAYEHQLGVLGNVSRRSDAAAGVRLPAPNELARPHVRPAGLRNVPVEASPPEPTNAHVGELDPIEVAASSDLLVFGDEVAAASAETFEITNGKKNKPHLPRQRRGVRPSRRALTGIAAVALGAIAIAGWQFEANESNHSPRITATHTKDGTSHNDAQANSGVAGSALRPISSTNGVLTYLVPTGPLTVTFTADAPCWLGAEQNASLSGPWLMMKTLGVNSSWTYQANAPVVFRIGAPKALTVTLNGDVVYLSGSPNPYDISFVPSDSISA